MAQVYNGAAVDGEAASRATQLRGLRAIELLAERPMIASELARAMDTNRSTALRLLRELQAAGYVCRDGDSKAYMPVASWLWGMVGDSRDHVEFAEVVDPILADVRDDINESTAFAIPVRGAMVYTAYFSSHQHIALREHLGTVRPMYCSALGKAYLSGLDPADLDVELGRLDFVGGTQRAAAGPLELRQRIVEARERGYAVDWQESFEGGGCVAVPVYIGSSLVGAAGCQGPTSRLTLERLGEIGQRMARSFRDL